MGIDLSGRINAVRVTAAHILRLVAAAPEPTGHPELITSLAQLDTDIAYILEHREALAKLVPRLLLRRWAGGSFRTARRKIARARLLSSRQSERAVAQARYAALWAYQACDVAQAHQFVGKVLSNLEDFTLYSSSIEKGDLILSYKTETYLSHDLEARVVAVTTNSHITHTLMVSDQSPLQLLSVSPESRGFGFRNLAPKRGEMFIILRYRPGLDGIPKEKILESMDALYDESSQHGRAITFAESKSWVACGIGLIYVCSSYLFERPICLPNPIRNQKALFCSEFVDEVFARAGISLSPRSEHRAVIGPAEIFYSPFLEFKGVIFHAADRTELIKEVSKTFTFLYERVAQGEVGESTTAAL